jgi:hypothetical protein
MRRLVALVAVVTVALVGCGGGGSKSSTTAKASSVNLTGNFCTDGRSAANADIASAASNPSASDVLQKNLALLKKFESEAPSEIKSDVKTLVDAYGKFAAAMSSAGSDPQKIATALAPLQGEQAQLQAAAQHVNSYVASHCK